MFVKICGTTNLPDAELAVELGADALGFIFAPSKRRVSVEQAAAMTRVLPAHIMRVGVFTDPDVEAVASAVRQAGLAAVQMHWTYDPQVVAAFRSELGDEIRLWQVVGFPVDARSQNDGERRFAFEVQRALADPRLDYVLLDAVKGDASGGLGEAFSWGRAAPIVEGALHAAEQSRTGSKLPRLVLAGGLRAENVRKAIRTLRPWGVDVVSGVEASPGRKSAERMKAFMEAVREAEEGLSSASKRD